MALFILDEARVIKNIEGIAGKVHIKVSTGNKIISILNPPKLYKHYIIIIVYN